MVTTQGRFHGHMTRGIPQPPMLRGTPCSIEGSAVALLKFLIMNKGTSISGFHFAPQAMRLVLPLEALLSALLPQPGFCDPRVLVTTSAG